MVNLNEIEFNSKKKLNAIFPIFIKFNGDELTPVNVFYKLRGEFKFLLESASNASDEGRYSFMGSNPYLRISSRGENITIIEGEKTKEVKGKILDYAKKHSLKSY